jgi:hypothetical protein
MAAVAARFLAVLLIFLGTVTGPAFAETGASALVGLLRLDAVVRVMRAEAMDYSRALDRQMMGGTGGPYFSDLVGRLYDDARIGDGVTAAIERGMSRRDIDQSIAFFESGRGQRILSLETAARVAMADPVVEDIARRTYAALRNSDDARLADIRRFVVVNDLLERNVAGTLSANYQFLLGLAEAGPVTPDRGAIAAEVRAQEAAIREDTRGWLYGYLLMAYRPLDDGDLRAYTEYSATPAGAALNVALFEGFDTAYRGISYRLGLAVARAMASSDL